VRSIGPKETGGFLKNFNNGTCFALKKRILRSKFGGKKGGKKNRREARSLKTGKTAHRKEEKGWKNKNMK